MMANNQLQQKVKINNNNTSSRRVDCFSSNCEHMKPYVGVQKVHIRVFLIRICVSSEKKTIKYVIYSAHSINAMSHIHGKEFSLG